ncbi:MAG: CRISPR-associated endonuclease Cas2 [Lentisphaeria bacterium]|nr:CRISPR-associated endonuclease Cas2 [Lentisphaeria bacterium]
MWLYVFFDLPTNTKAQRHEAARFRKGLLQDGFTMMQYSVYIRHCASKESFEVHLKRVKSMVPPEGIVSALQVTDKQFGATVNFIGKRATPPPETPLQLEFF